MKIVKFKKCNVVYAENQSEYKQLPSYKHHSSNGEVVSCWKMSFKERLRVLFTGKVYLAVLSFNRPLTPCFIATKFEEIPLSENE